MIPWTMILKHTPMLLAAADALLARSRGSSAPDKTKNPEARLASLEQRSSESAQLIQDIARQIQALAVAQDVAVRRARVALGVAATAAALAVCATLLALLR